MKGSIIIFRILRHSSLKETNQFCKKFYGQDTSSHKGKYKYRRRGLLSEIPHIKLIRGVLIIPKRYRSVVTNFLRKYKAEVYTREVILTYKDKKSLDKGGEKA